MKNVSLKIPPAWWGVIYTVVGALTVGLQDEFAGAVWLPVVTISLQYILRLVELKRASLAGGTGETGPESLDGPETLSTGQILTSRTFWLG